MTWRRWLIDIVLIAGVVSVVFEPSVILIVVVSWHARARRSWLTRRRSSSGARFPAEVAGGYQQAGQPPHGDDQHVCPLEGGA